MRSYDESIVTYFDILDILGFRQLVDRFDCAAIADILNLFATSTEPAPSDANIWQWRFSTFSDLAIRSVPIFSDANARHSIGLLFQEVLEVATIQASLVSKGILLRGGVTIGKMYCADKMVFGPALNRTYDLERTVAHYPRIVVDPVVFCALRDIKELRSHVSAGDKSTLALALFLAQLAHDPDKANKIVIFDDPFNSQDNFRKGCTIQKIKKCGQECAQVIVLSHDPYFLKRATG